MSQSDLTGRVVLVTGASRGIGLATARAALDAGARVVMGARTAERLRRAAEELSARGEVAHRAIDVRDYGDMQAFVDLALERFGRADALVNDAGVAWAGDFAAMPPAEIEAAVAVNVGGVLRATRAVLPPMLERGAGTVVNISSGVAHHGMPGLAAYSASKFAVNGFTEALAGEVGTAGVGVYAVCPGRVATDMQETVSGRRQGMPPERIAAAVTAILGPEPPLRPGQCLDVYQ
ncbi:MAG TPA: SDR family oxidoreductase [Gammaproteobacteria bacterium]|nr:SDR family oxidoreductase [Gammaproteobacteria bacterium]